MRDECIDAVSRAAGRTLSSSEIDGIESRINGNLKQMFRSDRAGTEQLAEPDRLQKAAQMAAEQLQYEAGKKRADLINQIMVTDRNQQYIKAQVAKGMNELEAIRRMQVEFPDSRSKFKNVEQRYQGYHSYFVSKVGPIIHAIGDRFLGFWSDPEGQLAFLKEIYGEDSGRHEVKAAAKIWTDGIAEPQRVAFNSAGGNIGKMARSYLPQSWEPERVALAGREQFKSFFTENLDRRQYVNKDGSYYDGKQMGEFLDHAYDTLSSDGVLNMEPGKVTSQGGISNRGSEHRELHLKDAASYFEAQKQFGQKNVLASMLTHISHMARDTATLETFGPNAEASYKFLRDTALVNEVKKDPSSTTALQGKAKDLDSTFDFITGRVGKSGSPAVARFFDNLRALTYGARLGGSSVTALGDTAFLRLSALYNGASQLASMKFEGNTYNPFNAEEKRALTAQGHGVESMIGDMNRFGDEALGASVPANLTNAMFKVIGLHKLDGARKRAAGATLANMLGDLTRSVDKISDLDPVAYRNLLSKGVTEDTWQVWKRADLDMVGKDGFLSANKIAQIPDDKLADLGNPSQLRREAITSLLGYTTLEANKVVPAPGWKTRSDIANTFGNPTRGRIGSELVNTTMMFKGFPVSVVASNWARMMDSPTPLSKAAYAAMLIGGTTLAGAVTLQIKDLLAGRDPRNMTDPRFTLASFLQGGSMGVYGDTLFAGVSRGELTRDFVKTLVGPTADVLDTTADIVRGQVERASEGKKLTLAQNATKLAKSFTPFSSVFYMKAAMDHMIFQQIMEMANPGYNARMEALNRQNFGQQSWWRPGQMTPDRLPDPNAAFGR